VKYSYAKGKYKKQKSLRIFKIPI